MYVCMYVYCCKEPFNLNVIPASTIASYVTSSKILNCGSIFSACFGAMPKNSASNLSNSFNLPFLVGNPYKPDQICKYQNKNKQIPKHSVHVLS